MRILVSILKPVAAACYGAAILGICVLAVTAPAAAQQAIPIKVGILRATNVLALNHAIDAGHMTRQGLQLELIVLNSGPAIGSAVASGSVDIGWSATPPVINARANNQPFKLFVSLSIEKAPDVFSTWVVASEKSGVKSFADLKGKTIAMNTAGAHCEMQLKSFLAKSGLAWSDVKTIVVPFPQIPAALQLGNADAACAIEPIYSSMKANPDIKPVTIASGSFPDMQRFERVSVDAFFAREDWLAKNSSVAARFARAVQAAIEDIAKDRSIMTKLLEREFKLPAGLAAQIQPTLDPSDVTMRPKDLTPMIEGLKAAGILKTDIKAEDLIFPLPK